MTDTHTFTPSRPDAGAVCVAERRRASGHLDDTMPCGYPAGHPIHAETPVQLPTTGETHAAALNDLAEVRRALDTGGRMPQRDAAMAARLDCIEAALRCLQQLEAALRAQGGAA